MSRILVCTGGREGNGYEVKANLERVPRQRVETALREWVEENGVVGETYTVADFYDYTYTVKEEKVKKAERV